MPLKTDMNVSLLNRIGIKEIKDALFDTLNINQAKLISFSRQGPDIQSL